MLDDDPFAKSNPQSIRLEDLSIRELKERISDLEAEIRQINDLIEAKEGSKKAADSFLRQANRKSGTAFAGRNTGSMVLLPLNPSLRPYNSGLELWFSCMGIIGVELEFAPKRSSPNQALGPQRFAG